MSTKGKSVEIGEDVGGSESERSSFRRGLLAWFDGHQRDLPWRHVDDPYAVWVSEIMLQQTRVATVIDYFERWMVRFPTIEDLASAAIEEVLEMWSGLGYYRRARFLHRGAGVVVDEYGGTLPTRVSELKKLPGIGPYTAGAISSIAFGQVEPLVDGNVMRVISRLFTIAGEPRRSPAKGKIWKRAEELVDPVRPGDFNQALMELGSEVCTARGPGCVDCPVQAWCSAADKGCPEKYPQTKKRPKQRPMRGRSCVVHRSTAKGREFLLCRRAETGLLGGLWEFPSCEQEGKGWPRVDELNQRLATGIDVDRDSFSIGRSLGSVEHIFSHRRLQLRVHDLELGDDAQMKNSDEDRWQWVSAEELSGVASAALLGKIERLWSDKTKE